MLTPLLIRGSSSVVKGWKEHPVKHPGATIIDSLVDTVYNETSLYLVGGWLSNTQTARGSVSLLQENQWTLSLTDLARIGIQPVGLKNRPDAHFVSWHTHTQYPDREIRYSDNTNSVGVGATLSTNFVLGATVQPEFDANSETTFLVGGRNLGGSILRTNRRTNATTQYATGLQSHGAFCRAVRGPGNKAYVFGGGTTTTANNLVSSFQMNATGSAAMPAILAPMPFPARRGIAYLSDPDTIVYIGGNMSGDTIPNGLVLDDASDRVQRYSISKNTWTVDSMKFPVKIVGGAYTETSTHHYILFGHGNTENKMFTLLKK